MWRLRWVIAVCLLEWWSVGMQNAEDGTIAEDLTKGVQCWK